MSTQHLNKSLKLLVASLAASSLISLNAVAADDDSNLINMKTDANIENRSADKSAVLPQSDQELTTEEAEANGDNWSDTNEDATAYNTSDDKDNANADYSNATTMSKTLHFEFDSTELTDQSETVLEELKEQLDNRENQTAQVEIVGYADSTGPEEYNKYLSEQRAEAIKSALTGLDVTVSDWSVEGEGEENPIAQNDTRDGRAENRRVELSISLEPEEKVSANDM